jgi:hypothetical protein
MGRAFSGVAGGDGVGIPKIRRTDFGRTGFASIVDKGLRQVNPEAQFHLKYFVSQAIFFKAKSSADKAGAISYAKIPK